MIGQRVVIRRLVRGETGPTGGPAMTDLLGVCESWSDGFAVVRPDSGTPVPIPIGDIVSGKPVPPRPSVRHRVTVVEAEAHTAALVAGVEATPLGAWSLRLEVTPTGRLRRRFNSCLAVGDPGMPIGDAAAQVTRFYREAGRTPYLSVERDGDLERALRDLGWVPDPTGDADLLLAAVAQVRRRLPRAEAAIDLAVHGPRAVATIGTGCDPVAEGHAGLDGDWLGLHGLIVDPAHRRRGLATEVIAELLDWGAEQGARTAWLHVETDNDAARALYEPLGFAVHHGMRYLTAPPQSDVDSMNP